jgi:hypothetical protein
MLFCRLSQWLVVLTLAALSLRRTASSDYDLSELGALFREAKFLLRTEFIEYNNIYVPRVCNKPAHVLATRGLSGVQNDHQIWMDHVPSDVSRGSVR